MTSLPLEYGCLLIEIDGAFQAATGHWRGCDFNTEFGRSKLNLMNLRSSQALLLSRATSGPERTDWRAAVTWLEAVEEDALTAELEARRAMQLARVGLLAEALQHAKTACDLEARHHERLIWRPFQQLIELACAGIGNTHATPSQSS